MAVRVAGVDTASKSFRVGDVNFIRELFVIDVYADIPPEDPEQDAVFAPPWSTLPWHLMVLMEEAVGRGWAAFSQAEAARRGVEWLDLVRSDAMKTRLAALVDQFEQQAFRPADPAIAGKCRGGAQTLGGAVRVLPEPRPFPGDQWALPAQKLVGGERQPSRCSAT